MDLNEILVFTQVVQSGSFTAAARELRMPKSTVSRKVSELERRLGARLLQRTTRRLSLTDVGRTYYMYGERIVADVEAAELAVTRLQLTPRGPLRVTAPLSFSFVGPAIAAFLQRYPEVQLDVVCTDRVVDLVDEGFDLAIRAGPLRDSTLIARPILGLRRFAVASPRYIERRGAPAAPAELEAHECLAFGAGPERTRWQLHAEGDAVEVRIAPRLVVNDFDLLREAAIAGLGIALIDSDRCSAELRARRLRRVLPQWSSAETTVHAVYPSTRYLSPKVKAFIDHLRGDALGAG